METVINEAAKNAVVGTPKYVCLKEEMYREMEKSISLNRRTLVVHGTGLGKTPLVLRYLHNNPSARPLVLVPQRNAYDTWSKAEEVKARGGMVCTIQKFYTSYEDAIFNDVNLIVIDEAHHFKSSGAWGRAVNKFLEEHAAAKLLGVTAEFNRGDGSEVSNFFDGNLVRGLTIDEAISKGQIWPIRIVQCKCGLKEDKMNSADYINLFSQSENQEQLRDLVSMYKNSGKTKGIVYAPIQFFEQVIAILQPLYPNVKFRAISSHTSSSDQEEIKRWFADTDEGFIVNENMFKESSHFSGINTVFNFSKIRSQVAFHQMIGRLSVMTNKPDPHAVFFDVTNSEESLKYYKSKSGESKKKEEVKPEQVKTIKKPQKSEFVPTAVKIEARNKNLGQVLKEIKERIVKSIRRRRQSIARLFK